MKSLTILVAALLLSIGALTAQTNGQVIAAGNGYSYILNIPADWESSFTKAEEQHLKAILVPAGETWENSKSVIYSNVVHPNALKNETIFDIVNYDISMYEIADPNLILEDGQRIQVNKGNGVAMVVKVFSDATGSFEAIAYINEGDKIPFIVLSSMDKASFDRDYPMFEQVVSSYKYYSNTTMVNAK